RSASRNTRARQRVLPLPTTASRGRTHSNRRSTSPRRKESRRRRDAPCAKTGREGRFPLYLARRPTVRTSCPQMWLGIRASARIRPGSFFRQGLPGRQLFHRLGELHIQFGQAPCIMGREGHFDRLVDIEPFRVVVHFFGDQCRPCHESEGLVEVLEDEFPCDGIPASHFGPAAEPRQRGFSGFTGKLLRHGLSLTAANARPSQRVRPDTTFSGSIPAIRGIHVLVIKYRQGGGNRRSRTPNLPAVSRVDLRRELRVRGSRTRLGQPRLHGSSFSMRAAARVRPHFYGARFQRANALRDLAADRRRGATSAHSRGTV